LEYSVSLKVVSEVTRRVSKCEVGTAYPSGAPQFTPVF